jgi:hypothetical protein
MGTSNQSPANEIRKAWMTEKEAPFFPFINLLKRTGFAWDSKKRFLRPASVETFALPIKKQGLFGLQGGDIVFGFIEIALLHEKSFIFRCPFWGLCFCICPNPASQCRF